MDKNQLISFYVKDHKTLREIGRISNVGHMKIKRLLSKYGIEIRKWSGNKMVELKCDYCRKPIFRYPSTLSSGKRGNFCSYACIYSWQAEGGMRGEKSPAWRGGITAISSNNLKTQEFVALKKIVLNKFPLCVICGDTRYLHIHHIKTRREYPGLAFDEKNLITLCRPCHSSVKGKEKIWEEFFVRIVCKGGELRESLNAQAHDNPQPSQSNVINFVDWKVQRLTGEDTQSDKPDTSAAPERDEIVRAYSKE